MAPLHTSQSDAHRPSTAEIMTQTATAAISGGPYGMSSIATTSLSLSLDTTTTLFEATTLPKNAYLTSNLLIGIQ